MMAAAMPPFTFLSSTAAQFTNFVAMVLVTIRRPASTKSGTAR